MPVFNTFFMGGFECADQINRAGARINLLSETGHDTRVWEDYARLAGLGIRTVREGLCWSSVETQAFAYDFSEVKQRIEAAAHFGMQQIWDLCHFGYPDGIYPTHPHFCARFTALCEAFARFYNTAATQQLFVVPINEISFLSWHSGDVRGTVPFAVNCGFDIKYHLCKAAIAGINALRTILPDCRILLVEPMIRVHPAAHSNPAEVHGLNEAQFQAMDIIAGRMCPELGGNEANLDILGFNYYWDCQWQHGSRPLPWPEPVHDLPEYTASELTEAFCAHNGNEVTHVASNIVAAPVMPMLRRVSLAKLLTLVHARYERPLFLSETGHFGCGRAPWLDEVTQECVAAIAAGVDLHGICLYPVIDRPDWDDLSRYHNAGIWDVDGDKNRVPHADYIAMLRSCISRVESLSDASHQVANDTRESGAYA